MIENTDYVIEYYRNNTMAVGFYGDTIANSLMDILAITVGYLAASRLRFLTATGLFVATEFVTLYAIRDSLLLNVLILVHPLDALKEWQLALM